MSKFCTHLTCSTILIYQKWNYPDFAQWPVCPNDIEKLQSVNIISNMRTSATCYTDAGSHDCSCCSCFNLQFHLMVWRTKLFEGREQVVNPFFSEWHHVMGGAIGKYSWGIVFNYGCGYFQSLYIMFPSLLGQMTLKDHFGSWLFLNGLGEIQKTGYKCASKVHIFSVTYCTFFKIINEALTIGMH